MSYLGIALRRVAEQNHIRQADVARSTGLTNAHLSRLFSGVQTYVSDKDLVTILEHVTRNAGERAEIIAARCMDVRVGPGSDLVDIQVQEPKSRATGKKPKGRAAAQLEYPAVDLSHEAERAFAWLRSQCPVNPDLERHLIGYAKLTGMK